MSSSSILGKRNLNENTQPICPIPRRATATSFEELLKGGIDKFSNKKVYVNNENKRNKN